MVLAIAQSISVRCKLDFDYGPPKRLGGAQVVKPPYSLHPASDMNSAVAPRKIAVRRTRHLRIALLFQKI
jgi:hypothetical protein